MNNTTSPQDTHKMEPNAASDPEVLSGIERDLKDAKALLADAANMQDGQKYRKAAEIILLKVLLRDPANAEANALLATIKSFLPPQAATAPAPRVEQPAMAVATPKKDEPKPVATPPAAAEPNKAALSVEKKTEPKTSGTSRKLPVLIAVIILITGGALLFRSTASTQPVEPAAFPASLEIPPASSSEVPPGDFSLATLPVPPVQTVAMSTASAPGADLTSATSALPNAVPAPEPGSLAVSSPTSADIFEGEKYLGSTPMTLRLPAGRHTLEYRHGELRTVVTHDIKSKETATAMIPFEVTVQINARPWAQVFVEGTARRPLGQTPVSSVRLPVGTVLAFENPNFPKKTRRVSETDSTIQIVFP
jgi:hypothetical protein